MDPVFGLVVRVVNPAYRKAIAEDPRLEEAAAVYAAILVLATARPSLSPARAGEIDEVFAELTPADMTAVLRFTPVACDAIRAILGVCVASDPPDPAAAQLAASLADDLRLVSRAIDRTGLETVDEFVMSDATAALTALEEYVDRLPLPDATKTIIVKGPVT